MLCIRDKATFQSQAATALSDADTATIQKQQTKKPSLCYKRKGTAASRATVQCAGLHGSTAAWSQLILSKDARSGPWAAASPSLTLHLSYVFVVMS